MKSPTKSRIDQARNCLDWLDICHADCCRKMNFTLPDNFDKKSLIKGDRIILKIQEQKDSKWYFELHNMFYIDKHVIFTLSKFEYINNKLRVYAKCNYLTKDNLCMGHPHSKPYMCQYLTQETAHEDGQGFVLDEKCLFRYKIER